MVLSPRNEKTVYLIIHGFLTPGLLLSLSPKQNFTWPQTKLVNIILHSDCYWQYFLLPQTWVSRDLYPPCRYVPSANTFGPSPVSPFRPQSRKWRQNTFPYPFRPFIRFVQILTEQLSKVVRDPTSSTNLNRSWSGTRLIPFFDNRTSPSQGVSIPRSMSSET